MADRRRDGKRKKVEIDLTSETDEDDAPPRKVQAGATKQNAQPRNSTAYQTPPASSAAGPRSSQPMDSQPQGYEAFYGSNPTLPSNQHTQAEREAWLQAIPRSQSGHSSWLEDEDDDFNQIIQSTQAASTGTEQLYHYGDLPTKVVGVQYYRGHASPCEQILMRREPSEHESKASLLSNSADLSFRESLRLECHPNRQRRRYTDWTHSSPHRREAFEVHGQ